MGRLAVSNGDLLGKSSSGNVILLNSQNEERPYY